MKCDRSVNKFRAAKVQTANFYTIRKEKSKKVVVVVVVFIYSIMQTRVRG